MSRLPGQTPPCVAGCRIVIAPDIGRVHCWRYLLWIPLFVSRRPEIRTNTGEQAVLAERFGEIANHAGLQSALPRPFVGKASNEDGGNGLTGRDQSIMKLNSGHPRHSHACHHAGDAAPPRGSFGVAESRPPCASTIERLIASPIPIPSGLVV